MEFEELTQEQQVAYLAFMLLVRPMVGKIENVNLWIEYMTTLWIAEIQPIHNLLSAGAVVPDNTGYPNSSTLTKADVDAALALLVAVFANHTAGNTGLAVKCVGPENIITPTG